jgi:hypothetical protein
VDGVLKGTGLCSCWFAVVVVAGGVLGVRVVVWLYEPRRCGRWRAREGCTRRCGGGGGGSGLIRKHPASQRCTAEAPLCLPQSIGFARIPLPGIAASKSTLSRPGASQPLPMPMPRHQVCASHLHLFNLLRFGQTQYQFTQPIYEVI